MTDILQEYLDYIQEMPGHVLITANAANNAARILTSKYINPAKKSLSVLKGFKGSEKNVMRNKKRIAATQSVINAIKQRVGKQVSKRWWKQQSLNLSAI